MSVSSGNGMSRHRVLALASWRAGGGQAEHRGAVLPRQVRHLHQLAGASGIGNHHEQVAGMRHRGDHPLHQHVGLGAHRQVEAEELVLRVERYRGRGAKTEEVDLPGLDQQVHGAVDDAWVEQLVGAVEGGDGVAEDLPRIGFRPVVLGYRLGYEGSAAGQALGQLDLQFRIAAHAEGATEAVHRRFADRCRLGQGGDAEAGGLLRVLQDDLGDFALRLVQFVQAALDLLQQVFHPGSSCSVGPAGKDRRRRLS